MTRDPRWSVPLNTALIYSYLRLLQCSLLYIHYGNGTRCVPFGQSWAASAPARVSDTFDNPINIYEALYWNNTELLYTHTCVGVCVCMSVSVNAAENEQQEEYSQQRVKKNMQKTPWHLEKLLAQFRMLLLLLLLTYRSYAPSFSSVVVLWCGQLGQTEPERELFHCYFRFFNNFKSNVCAMLTPSEIALRLSVCVWVGVCV